ncbi:MAG TPA: SCO family protein [Steroidobacteraceae bacterium]|nr:SCO family protein [Steroidobacteraceae bacterium]
MIPGSHKSLCWRTQFLCAALLGAGLLGAGGASGRNDDAVRLDQLPQQWRDDRGTPLALTALLGQRVVIAMAYTRCRTICPATIAELKRMQRTLDERGEAASFVIVGFDPDSDDPASWRQYRINHQLDRSNWHFLTGSRQETRQFAHQLGFDFWTYDTHVMHEPRLVVFDAQGRWRGAVNPSSGNWPALL